MRGQKIAAQEHGIKKANIIFEIKVKEFETSVRNHNYTHEFESRFNNSRNPS